MDMLVITRKFKILILYLQCITTIIGSMNKVDQVLNFLLEKDPSLNVLFYSDTKEFLTDSKTIQLPTTRWPIVINESFLHKDLTKYFEENERDHFTMIFYASNFLGAMNSIEQVGLVVRNKTLRASRMRRMPYYIIIWPSDNGSIPFLTYLENTKIKNCEKLNTLSAHSQLYVVEFPSTENSSNFTIYELYSLPDYSNRFINIVNKVPLENFGFIGLTRSNFHGAVIKATAPEKNLTQGEVVFNEFADPLEFKEGFGVDIFNVLRDSLNFKSLVIPATSWASQYPNGSWYGMAKEIIDGTADIAVAKTSILLNRAEALKYLAPTHALAVYAFFEQPSVNSVRNIFFGPFSTSLWHLMIVTYTVIVLCILTIFFVKIKLLKCSCDDDEFLINESLIWSIGTFCQQGWYTAPSSLSLRIVFLCGVFLGLILYVAYSATLVSMFSTTIIPIKSLDDLLNSQIQLAVDVNNRGAVALVNQNNQTGRSQQYSSSANRLKRRFHAGMAGNNLIDLQGGISLVFAGQTAFLTFKDSFYTTTRNKYRKIPDSTLCKKVSTVPVLDSKYKSGLFVSKNSPFKEFFNIKMTTMYTSGLMSRYVKDYENTYTPICNSQFSNSLGIDVEVNDVYSAYVLMVCGICSSLILLFVEYCIYHWNCYRGHDKIENIDSLQVHIIRYNK